MTLRSGSSSPRSSPRDQTAQRSVRTTLCPDSGLGRPSRTSPLKRSDGMMNMDEASRGSPVAKRRNSHFGYFSSISNQKPPVFGSPSFGAGSRSPPKRNSTNMKKPSGHIFEKPSFVRSRPMGRQRLDFSSSSDTTSRVRRVASVENFFAPGLSRESPFAARNAPLPSASVHPHPLSQSAFGTSREVNQLSSGESSDWRTPQNYKSAKPNILAFHSTGFVPKRGRTLDGDKDHAQQPDTPCKRTTVFPGSALQINNFGAKIPMGDLGSPHTPAPISNQGTNLLNRRDSFISNDGDEQDDSTQSSGDYDLPPTPTKKSWNDFDDDSVFTMNKRLRTESNCTSVICHCLLGIVLIVVCS
jgi:mitosis inhibitor protein kinase SWE1